MTGTERVKAAFSHSESDRVPFDFCGHLISGIHREAYEGLRAFLGLPKLRPNVFHRRQQTVMPDEDILRAFGVDTRSLASSAHRHENRRDAEYEYYRDELGVEWRRSSADGLYFELHRCPFAGDDGMAAARKAAFPDWSTADRTDGIVPAYESAGAGAFCRVLDLPVGLEVQDGCFFTRGYMDFYMDVASDEESAEYLLDRQLEMQIGWWRSALKRFPKVEVVRTGDDLGDQRTTLMDPQTYRKLIKPRHAKLFAAIKAASPGVRILLHSDGAIRSLLPDLIEIGIDGLNPVQYTLPGMDAAGLKKDFGAELTFWGGAVDTQEVLPRGSPAEIKDAVRRSIETLAVGGGFVCCQTHIIQRDVPVENLAAYFEAVAEYR